MADKIRVAVLYGGRSLEHEVSLLSAANVIENLDPNIFEVIPIGIDKEGNWFLGKDVFLKSLEHKKVSMLCENNLQPTWFTPAWVGKPRAEEQQLLPDFFTHEKKSAALFDVVFPMIHGTFCEDGCLQGLLELANLPYVGASVLGSAIGMDKDIAKRLAKAAGVNVTPYMMIRKNEWDYQAKEIIQNIQAKFQTFPLFVKPANAGSSIGINKIKNAREVSDKINATFRFDHKILVEQAVNAIELEVAVLESLKPNQEPVVSVVGEIKYAHEFYSYKAKYLDASGTTLEIPAVIDETIAIKARNIAKIIFQNLECEGMARVDLFLDKENNQLYFNEINTIPGFTAMSMYPKLMAASGISYPDLLKHLILLALNKYKNKSKLVRCYEE